MSEHWRLGRASWSSPPQDGGRVDGGPRSPIRSPRPYLTSLVLKPSRPQTVDHLREESLSMTLVSTGTLGVGLKQLTTGVYSARAARPEHPGARTRPTVAHAIPLSVAEGVGWRVQLGDSVLSEPDARGVSSAVGVTTLLETCWRSTRGSFGCARAVLHRGGLGGAGWLRHRVGGGGRGRWAASGGGC